MTAKQIAGLYAGLLATMIAAGPADAQKASDKIRLAFFESIKDAGVYYNTGPEQQLVADSLFGTLVTYDQTSSKFMPSLAKSWQEIDHTTLDLELREDITFHNGDKFDAEDAFETLDFARQMRRYKIRGTTRAVWIKSVEKLGPYKIRIRSNEPDVLAMFKLGSPSSLGMYDSKLLNALDDENKSDYGRKSPIGTGPYQVVTLNSDRGVVLSKFQNFVPTNKRNRAGTVGTFHIIPILDENTRVAQLVSGGVDVVMGTNRDQVANLNSDPRFTATSLNSLNYFYFQLDAANRSGNKPLADLQVRKAIFMAIDRDAIRKNMIAGESLPMDGLCLPEQRDCDYSVKPYAYNPAEAKKLLAAAGYGPNSIEIEISARTDRMRPVADAISGYLHAVGIKSTVKTVTSQILDKMWRDGSMQGLAAAFSMFSTPDASGGLIYYNSDESSWRDYAHDKELTHFADLSLSTFDSKERKNIHRAAYNLSNERAYVLPIGTMPNVYIHTKDIGIHSGSLNGPAATLADFYWK